MADVGNGYPITLTNFGLSASSTSTAAPANGTPPYTNIFLKNISATPGLLGCLSILPNNGAPGLGNSYAMAAGIGGDNATNYLNSTTGAFTLEALVNCQGNIFSSSEGNGEWEIFSGDNQGTSPQVRGWQFRLQNAPAPILNFNFISLYTGATVENYTVNLPTTGPDAVATNQWYHVAVTYSGYAPASGTAGVLNLYWTLLDNTRTTADLLYSYTNTAAGSLGTATPSPSVGGSQRTQKGVGNAGSFQGFIDEVRVSQIARSATDMAFNTIVTCTSPTFSLDPPASTTIGYGKTLTLNTLVSATPPVYYFWQQTNTVSGGWTYLAGQTNNDLVINNATFAAAGLYRLIASNYCDFISYTNTSTIASVSVGAVFSEVFNTGCDANDVADAVAGATDLHYTLSDSADANNPGPATAVWNMTTYPISANGGGFANIDGVSQWIGPGTDTDSYTSPQGYYVYRTHILADSVNTALPCSVSGTWWGNTQCSNLLVNGLSLGISNSYVNLPIDGTPFVITNGFVPGLNTLDFVVPCVNPNGSYPESAVRIEISSALGQALSAGKPQILTEPASVTVSDNNDYPSSATFSVVATGRPPLTYQWVDQQAGSVAGATNRTLTFSSPTAGAQGTNFYVVVSNGSGSTNSTVATLTLVDSAEAPTAPNYSYVVYTNGTLTLDTSDMLLAATDADNLALTISLNDSATNGTLTENESNGSIYTYTPVGPVGEDSFTYTIDDPYGTATTGTVLINVVAPLLPTSMQASAAGTNFVFSGNGSAPGRVLREPAHEQHQHVLLYRIALVPWPEEDRH